MAFPEQLWDLNNVSWAPQASPLAAERPDHFLYAVETKAKTNYNWDKRGVTSGTRAKLYHMQPGLRTHEVSMKFEATPNAMLRYFDQLLAASATIGDPLAYNTFNDSDRPHFYTVDVGKGDFVHRFIGVQVKEGAIEWEDNGGMVPFEGMALKSWDTRTVANISGTTVTLKSDATHTDPVTGLCNGDLLRFTAADGSSAADTTVNGAPSSTTQFTVASGTGISIGDTVYLRQQTFTPDSQTGVFEWGGTEIYIAATKAAADLLTQSSMEPADDGTEWKIMFDNQDDDGAKRSGSRDPATFVKTQSGMEFTLVRYFANEELYNKFVNQTARGIVIRHFGPTVAGAAAVATTQRAVASNIATLTTASHDIVPGQTVVVTGMTDTAYNGTFRVLSVPDATHITYALTHADETVTADTAGTVTPAASRTQLKINMYKAVVTDYEIETKVGEIITAKIIFETEPDATGKHFDVELSHEETTF